MQAAQDQAQHAAACMRPRGHGLAEVEGRGFCPASRLLVLTCQATPGSTPHSQQARLAASHRRSCCTCCVTSRPASGTVAMAEEIT